MPGLYVVATPIGNLEDFSPRARRVLAEATLVAAEDTRTAATLLPTGVKRPRMVSLTEHNVIRRIPRILETAAAAAVALVSEAGTPALADPGARLVAAAHDEGIPVYAVPGPSALTAALSISGFDGSDVYFLGFLPRQPSARKARLRAAVAAARTVVFLEGPGRLHQTLDEIANHLGDPELAVCRELTKVHEEARKGRASDLARHYGSQTKGECTVVLRSPPRQPSRESASRLMAAMQAAGAKRAPAAAAVARETGLARNDVYALWPEPADGLAGSAVLPSPESPS